LTGGIFYNRGLTGVYKSAYLKADPLKGGMD